MDAERVVAFFGDYGLVAYDHDGRELWRRPLGPFDNVYGMGASPVLAGGLVVLACDQSLGSFVAAFDAKTGDEKPGGSATFQAALSGASEVGSERPSAMPDPFGPRKRGQSEAASGAAATSARAASALLTAPRASPGCP